MEIQTVKVDYKRRLGCYVLNYDGKEIRLKEKAASRLIDRIRTIEIRGIVSDSWILFERGCFHVTRDTLTFKYDHETVVWKIGYVRLLELADDLAYAWRLQNAVNKEDVEMGLVRS